MELNNYRFQKIFSNTTPANLWKSLVILFISLILTTLAVVFTHHDVENQAEREYFDNCNEIKSKIRVRLEAHEQLLRTTSAFFETSDTVTRSEWKEYVHQANTSRNLPGIQGIGYSILFPKRQLKHHIQNIQKQGFPKYTVKPVGDRDLYSSIIYLEPFAGRKFTCFWLRYAYRTCKKKGIRDIP
jgi:CHASE1-domain containing sensor protein